MHYTKKNKTDCHTIHRANDSHCVLYIVQKTVTAVLHIVQMTVTAVLYIVHMTVTAVLYIVHMGQILTSGTCGGCRTGDP